ncbi:6-phosphogluconolactonase [Sulfuritalea sp.]|uniref:6-phosphogluconolactonase n=1 Tax=Sulfuritalea sp. TaxID=2480090 RepID=UPI0025EAD677|nr:6-phosphogluconolactonase [Sulfuritalea sp.]
MTASSGTDPKPNVVVCPTGREWAEMAAAVIGSSVDAVIAGRGACSLMLTGGKTAEGLYNHWFRFSLLPRQGMRYFFGDERCVPPEHRDSNFGLVMRTLFANERPSGACVSRMEADDPDREAAATRYEALLPEQIDILLLGMGTDGHVASLFPYSEALRTTERTVLPVQGPDAGHPRLSITGRVVANAETVFLLATGEDKGRVLAEAMKSPRDVMSLPVRMALNATWLLDEAAAGQIR